MRTPDDDEDYSASEADDSEPGICPHCNGSGEGQNEGSRCNYCKGMGEI